MDKPKTYRKRPTTIEAMYWAGPGADNTGTILEWCGTRKSEDGDDLLNFVPLAYPRPQLWVEANDAPIPLNCPVWIAKDSIGFYPIDPSVFESSYEDASIVTVSGDAVRANNYGAVLAEIWNVLTKSKINPDDLP